ATCIERHDQRHSAYSQGDELGQREAEEDAAPGEAGELHRHEITHAASVLIRGHGSTPSVLVAQVAGWASVAVRDRSSALAVLDSTTAMERASVSREVCLLGVAVGSGPRHPQRARPGER